MGNALSTHSGEHATLTPTPVSEFDRALVRQRELEETCMAEGARRFRERVAKATEKGVATREGAARSLMRHAIEPVEKGIQAMLDEAEGKRGVKHCAVKWCKLAGADVAAYLTVKCILDGIGKRQSFGRVALTIAQHVIDDLRWRRFQAEQPQLFEYRVKNFQTSSYVHMARSLSATMGHLGIDVSDLDTPVTQRMLIGTKLIEIAMVTTSLFEVKTSKLPGRGRGEVRTEMWLTPTQETVEWVTKRNGALEDLSPLCLPMVVPPLPWGPNQRGGYRYALLGKYPLVRGVSSKHAKDLAEAEMPAVYEAVNHLQNTPWRINARILAVVEQLMSGNGGVAGLPSTVERELPPKPHDIATNPEAKKQWKKAAHRVRNENFDTMMEGIATRNVLYVARTMRDEPAMFFPYNCDFRGRVYPMTSHLTPQGSDLCKGLLTFAEGKPLGPDGAVWLALHGASCMDTTPEGVKVSRLTRQERVDWVVANTLTIVDCADDPVANQWWTKAEDPFQFLAFCFEWAGYCRLRTANGHGEDYVCSLPVAQDGSCNGLQHFSAMFRDPVGGTSVNLTPTGKPNDIYADVADTVLARVTEMAEAGNGLAQLWLDSGLVNRKLCKRPTMTFGYGSKTFGFVGQLKEYLRGLENWPQLKATFKDPEGKNLVSPMCRLMAKLIWEALGLHVVAAFDGMAWMQKAAAKVVSTGNAVRWSVPMTGFRVRQEYFRSDRKRVKTVLAGRVIQPSVYTPTEDILPHKQRNAIAPNVIHSLDAAALMLTVNQASAEGVECFGMVHDSYATVPGDAGLLARATRQCFLTLYTRQDVAVELHRQWAAQATEEVPVPPAHGDLDLGLVLVSDYFFA